MEEGLSGLMEGKRYLAKAKRRMEGICGFPPSVNIHEHHQGLRSLRTLGGRAKQARKHCGSQNPVTDHSLGGREWEQAWNHSKTTNRATTGNREWNILPQLQPWKARCQVPTDGKSGSLQARKFASFKYQPLTSCCWVLIKAINTTQRSEFLSYISDISQESWKMKE